MEENLSASSWIHFRHLPKKGDVMKILQEQVSQLCRPFGSVLSVVILHGRGQALLEMDSASAVDSFLLWSSQESDGMQKADIVDTTSQSPVEYQKSGKLRFKSWAQSASAERGRPRSNRYQHDVNSSIRGADSSNSNSSSNGCNVPKNDSREEVTCLNPSDDSIRGRSTHVYQLNFNLMQKHPAADVILREVGRCMTAVIKQIVFRDSEERMRARKMKKKQHETLMKEMKRTRDDQNDESKNDEESEQQSSQNTLFDTKTTLKSESFLSNWRCNKYRIKKEEMSLICWHYVASGGNAEFCPNYKSNNNSNPNSNPNREERLDHNSNSTVTDMAFSESTVPIVTSTEEMLTKKDQSTTKFSHSRSAVSTVCEAYHISRPVTEIPISLRVFEVDDFFPIARESCPMKNRVNLFLRNLTSSSSIFPDEKFKKRFLDIKGREEENLTEFDDENKTNNVLERYEFDNDKTSEIKNFRVKNKRCLILDGSQCNTVKTFLSCEKHSRTMKDIIVPNYCSSTFNLIKASNLCIPYLGSVRAYLDDYCMNDTVKSSSNTVNFSRNTVETMRSDVDAVRGRFGVDREVYDNNGYNDNVKDNKNNDNNDKYDNDSNDHDDHNGSNKFGFIYLDYCCRLNAGYKSVEKNPIKDIQCLFEYGLFDVHNTKDNSSDDCNNDDSYNYDKDNDNSDKKKAQNVSVSILAICLCVDEVEEDASEEDIELEVEVETTNPETFKNKNGKKTDEKLSKKRKFQNLKTFSQNKIVRDEESKSNSNLKKIVLEAAYKYGYKVEVHPERFEYGTVLVETFIILKEK